MLKLFQSFPTIAKKLPQATLGLGLFMTTGLVYADPIDGYWVYYDNQVPKYVIAVNTTSQGVNGVVVAGSHKYEGKTVLRAAKPQGNGQYIGGQAINPSDGSVYQANLTLNGNTMTMRAFKGIPAFGLTQTFTRLPAGYTFSTGK